MKKSYKNIRKISLFLIMTFIFITPFAMSKTSPEVRIDFVIGKVFLRSPEGNISEVKSGDHIYHLSELNTTEGSLVGFSNFYDQQFSLAGSGYIKIFHDILELRAGYLWAEAVNAKNTKYKIETPNAKITYEKGISIISYDQYAEKTQILTTQGQFNFMNIFEDHLKIEVSTGEFSYINKDYENGMPRKPTPAGQSTFLKITGLFSKRPSKTQLHNIDSSYRLVEKKSEEITLLGRLPSSAQKKSKHTGQIIYANIKKMHYGKKESDLMAFSHRKIASLASKKVVKKKKKFRPSYKKKSDVVIRVFGKAPKTMTLKKRVYKRAAPKEMKRRKPASVSNLNDNVSIKESSFDSSLSQEYKKQLRHSKQMNSLIRDLNAFDQDYQQSY